MARGHIRALRSSYALPSTDPLRPATPTNIKLVEIVDTEKFNYNMDFKIG